MTGVNKTSMAAAAFLALWLCLGVYAFNSPLAERRGDLTYDPLFFPFLLIAAGIALSCIVLAQGWMGERKAQAEPAQPGESHDARRIVGLMILIGAYFTAMPLAGFIPATAAFVALFAAYLGYRRWALLAAAAIFGSIAIWWVFTQWLKAPLPGLPAI